MNKVLLICLLLIIGSLLLWAEEVSGFKSSTQVLLVASYSFMGPEAGLGLDLSSLPHIVGSLALANVLFAISEGMPLFHFESDVKYFFRPENTGFYASVGISFLQIMVPPFEYYMPTGGAFFRVGSA